MVCGFDRLAGLTLVGISGVLFFYYTVWVIILPFVDEDHIVHKFFLDRFYAIAVPIALAAIATSGLAGFVAFSMKKHSEKPKSH